MNKCQDNTTHFKMISKKQKEILSNWKKKLKGVPFQDQCNKFRVNSMIAIVKF